MDGIDKSMDKTDKKKQIYATMNNWNRGSRFTMGTYPFSNLFIGFFANKKVRKGVGVHDKAALANKNMEYFFWIQKNPFRRHFFFSSFSLKLH